MMVLRKKRKVVHVLLIFFLPFIKNLRLSLAGKYHLHVEWNSIDLFSVFLSYIYNKRYYDYYICTYLRFILRRTYYERKGCS